MAEDANTAESRPLTMTERMRADLDALDRDIDAWLATFPDKEARA